MGSSAHRPARWSDGLVVALGSWLAFAALVALCAPARGADRLADPTQPPGATAPQDPLPSRRASTAPAAAASAPAVQSLHLPRQGAPSALVDGRIVHAGDRLDTPQGTRVVVAIDARGLLLRAPDAPAAVRATHRLDLLAGIVRRPTDAGPASSSRLAAQESSKP
jgi:hypothetical protein